MAFQPTRKPEFEKGLQRLDYAEYWKFRGGFEINDSLREREVIAVREIPAGATVCDIGCGTSRLPLALEEKGCDVSVADMAVPVLEGFERLGIKSFHIDLMSHPEEALDRQYDYIVMSEVLEHLPYPEEVIQALKSKARYFFFTIPNSAFIRYRAHLLLKGRFFTQWVFHPSEHLRYWSHIDFLDWLGAMGFRVIKSEASNGLWSKRLPLYRWWPNLFGHQICYLVEKKS